jgi:deoxyribodipyrimidine photo-lyase
MRHLFWFRQDLRLHDNPGLAAAWQAAQQTGGTLEACFIATPEQWRSHDLAPRRADLLERRLNALGAELAALGIRLHLLVVPDFAGVPESLLQWFTTGSGGGELYANRELAVDEVRRDAEVARRLHSAGIVSHWFDERCLFVPGRINTGSGDMFRVFTPFSRAWLRQLATDGFALAPRLEAQGAAWDWQAVELPYAKLPSSPWPVSEREIRERLWEFAQHKAAGYSEARDFPALPATSQLSPYLAMGALSIRQCLAALQAALGALPLDRGQPGFSWLNELIWREFYQHLLARFPLLAMGKPFKAEMSTLNWRPDSGLFTAWCQGQTGYPIVDAAMRCLNQTGWMHNRLRMIVASFLTKDLQQPWWWGERYFMQQLLDGELAANNGGWQWSAGTGADASPWFRIFNPTTQGQKFDPEGQFIRRYLPELVKVPERYIHTPHDWLRQHVPDHGYPAPIVDHAQARLLTLAMFKERGTGLPDEV